MNNVFLERKLIDTVGTKSENLHLMRFIAALMVIVFHSFSIATGSETGEWFRTITNNQITMGEFAVAIFFLCGGYLIAMSVEKNHTAKRYLAARIKRLFPSLMFVTVATVIFCSFISTWKPVGYVISSDTWKYLLNALLIRVHQLPGVFEGHANAVVNGSLWTLRLEFVCYVLCFIAYKLGFLNKKRFIVSIPLVAAGTLVVWKLSAIRYSLRDLISPVLLFYVGMAYWVYREHITLCVKYFAIAIVAFVMLFVLGLGNVAMIFAFPYIMMYLWFGMEQCSPKLGKLGNYSYGIYLWGFTVQQVVVHFWPGNTMSPMINVLISIPVSIILGWLTYEIVENKCQGIPVWIKTFKCPDVIYVAILVVYSMRHVSWGLDLADTGYSYSNFQYMSFEHMDTMWLFSTYLANVVGNLLTKLPFANKLLAMNVYTTMFIAALAVIGYFFCTRTLKMKRWVVFLGGLITLALSWCPSSVLYNYLTYVLVVLCVIFLYKGLTEHKKWWLFAAGICLGANVLTRFSNLPQALLIVAVWAYGFMESKESEDKDALQRTINRTLWCLGGYLSGLGAFLGYIHIRYGINEYVDGIIRLFAMTEQAEGYKPQGMIALVVQQYKDELPWVMKLTGYILMGVAIWAVIEFVKKYVKFIRECEIAKKVLDGLGIASSIALAPSVVRTLYYGGFCELNFYRYESILGPAIVFIVLTLVIGCINLVRKDVSKQEKLVAIMVMLLLIINSLGNSTGLFASFNNLCLAAPYTLWNSYQFIRNVKKNFAWPAKAVLIAFLYVLFWQVGLFGQYFFFTESSGATDVVTIVENNEVLEGIKMHPYKSEWLTSVSTHVNAYGLTGREVILYGNIPALSYYLQMPPAFNSWPDLGSYNIKQMEKDMKELQDQIDEGEVIAPLVIVEATISQNTADPKWSMILDFMAINNYECTFYNGKLLMYEPMLSE